MKLGRFSIVAAAMLLLSPIASMHTATKVFGQQSKQNCSTIDVPAKNFSSSTGIEIEAGKHPRWGLNTIHNAPPYTPRMSLAEYDFNACGGPHRLEVEYAAAESRPVNIYVNGKLAFPNGLQQTTGGWSTADLRPIR